MRALLLVDIQYDFLPGGALAVPQGDDVIPVANRLQPAFEIVVASQDWHPHGHGSFASSHPGRRVGEMGELAGLPQVMWPDHCIQGTHGAELAADLSLERVEAIFRKGTDPTIDSYSAFFDNGHRKSTGLGDYLRGMGVHEVTLVGLATDYCVRFSALDARAQGFQVVVVEDGCRGVELLPGDCARALAAVREAGGRVVRADSPLTER